MQDEQAWILEQIQRFRFFLSRQLQDLRFRAVVHIPRNTYPIPPWRVCQTNLILAVRLIWFLLSD